MAMADPRPGWPVGVLTCVVPATRFSGRRHFLQAIGNVLAARCCASARERSERGAAPARDSALAWHEPTAPITSVKTFAEPERQGGGADRQRADAAGLADEIVRQIGSVDGTDQRTAGRVAHRVGAVGAQPGAGGPGRVARRGRRRDADCWPRRIRSGVALAEGGAGGAGRSRNGCARC